MDKITGTGANDILDVSGQAGPYEVDGLGGDDTIRGSQAGDVITGGAGYDALYGNGGDDVFLVNGASQGDDQVFGGEGFDTVQGGAGDDTIRLSNLMATHSLERIDGGTGTNVLMGTGSDNTLDLSGIELVNIARIDAGGGNDRITGTAGNDIIIGGVGYDTLNGGGGDDVFLVSGTNQGDDTIFGGDGFDTIQGSAGDDTIRLSNLTAAHSLERIDGGAGLNVLMGTGSDNTLDLSGTELVNIARIDAGGGNDRVTGTAANDIIIGGAGYDTLTGGGGTDTALYTANASDYSVTVADNKVTVARVGGGEVDTLYGFTYVQFADQTVQVSGATPPSAVADSATTAEDTPVVIDVLGNDSSANGPLAVTSTTQGAHGAVVIGSDGTVSYTPDADFVGTDSFSYTLADGTGTASTTVSVTVTEVNDAPVANADAGFNATQNQPLTIPLSQLLANDTDVDGDVLSIVAVGNASGGTVELVDDTVVFTPNAGYTGAAGFAYTLSDGQGGSATGAVSLTVNEANTPPVAMDDVAFTDEDTAIAMAASSLLVNDTDAEGHALSVAAVGNATGGTVTLSDGNIVFTPTANFNGTAGFDYTVADGKGGTDVGRVSLTVNPVNDAPLATADVASTTAGTPVTMDVLQNDSDADGDPLTIASVAQAGNGSVVLNPDGTLTYTPNPGFTGTDVFSYAVTDGTESSTGSVTVNVQSAATTLTGTQGNDILDVSGQAGPYEIDGLGGDDTIRGSQAGDVITGGAGYDALYGNGGDDVFLVNGASQGDDQVFGGEGFDTVQGGAGDDTIRLSNLMATHSLERIDGGTGTNVLMGTGSDNTLDLSGTELVNIARIDAGGGNDRVTGTSGNDVIIGGAGYDTLNGGGGDDVFLVTGTNQGDDQIFGGDGFDTVQGGAGDDTIRLSNLTAAHSLERIDGGAGTNVLMGTGSDNTLDLSGTELVNIARIDAGGGNDRVTGTAGNDIIIGGAGYDTLTGGGGVDTALYTANASDYSVTIADNKVTVARVRGGEVDTLYGFTYVQFADQIVQVSGATPPSAVADSATTAEDTPVVIDVLANDSSANGPLAVASTTQGAHGSVVIGADGTVSYTPNADFVGTDSFSYTLSDGTGTASTTVNLTVTGVNDAPVAGADAGFNATQGQVLTIPLAQLLANDTDVDGDVLSIVAVGNASGGTVELVDDTVVFTPDAGYTGAAGFGYTLSDGQGGSAVGAVSLTVNEANTPPVAGDDVVPATDEDIAITIAASSLLTNDADAEGHALSVAGVGNATGGTVVLNDGTIVFTPTANFNGAAGFDYTVADGKGGTDVGRVSLTVNPVNDAPLAAADTASTTAGTPVTVGVLQNDSDADGDPLTIASVAQAGNGSVMLNPDGTVTYTPNAGFTGTDAFSYAVTDGIASKTAAVSITVAPEQSFHGLIAAAPEQSWVKLNINEFNDAWTPTDLRPGNIGSPDRVISAWSSMAWDPNRGDLIFWGGGHANYGGNEVYRWDSDTLSWERASLPSDIVPVDSYPHYETVDGPDHAPISSHTYDNSEFLPIADRFMTFGGAAYGSGGSFLDDTGRAGPYFWDPSKADANKVGGLTGSAVGGSTSILGGEMWENRDTLDSSGRHPGDTTYGFLGGTTAYAEENGKDVIYFSDVNLWKYTINDVNDPSQDTYQMVGRYWEGFNGQGTAAIDVADNVFVRTAGNTFTYWDLDFAGGGNHNHNFTPIDASGQFDFNSLSRYGMDFDPVRGNFVLWGGDPEVWILTPPSELSPQGWTLTREPLMGFGDMPHVADGVSPYSGFNGVLGKWKYVASEDVFLGVIDPIKGTVWAYKPDDWHPPSAPTLVASDATVLSAGDLLSASTGSSSGTSGLSSLTIADTGNPNAIYSLFDDAFRPIV